MTRMFSPVPEIVSFNLSPHMYILQRITRKKMNKPIMAEIGKILQVRSKMLTRNEISPKNRTMFNPQHQRAKTRFQSPL